MVGGNFYREETGQGSPAPSYTDYAYDAKQAAAACTVQKVPDPTPLDASKTDLENGIHYLSNTIFRLVSKMEAAGLLRETLPELDNVKNGGPVPPQPIRTPLEYWMQDRTTNIRDIERVVEQLIARSS